MERGNDGRREGEKKGRRKGGREGRASIVHFPDERRTRVVRRKIPEMNGCCNSFLLSFLPSFVDKYEGDEGKDAKRE